MRDSGTDPTQDFLVFHPHELFVATICSIGWSDVLVKVITSLLGYLFDFLFFLQGTEVRNGPHFFDESSNILCGDDLVVVFQVGEKDFRNAIFDVGNDFFAIGVPGKVAIDAFEVVFEGVVSIFFDME